MWLLDIHIPADAARISIGGRDATGGCPEGFIWPDIRPRRGLLVIIPGVTSLRYSSSTRGQRQRKRCEVEIITF